MSAPNDLLTAAQSVDTAALTTTIQSARTTMSDTIDTNTDPIRSLATEVLGNITLVVSPLLEEADEAFHDVSTFSGYI